MIGYKKCYSHATNRFVLVELEIPDDATWFTPEFESMNKDYDTKEEVGVPNKDKKSRASHAKVVKIHGGEAEVASLHDPVGFKYHVGDVVKPVEPFDPKEIACSSGIHFFLDKETAIKYSSGCLFSKSAGDTYRAWWASMLWGFTETEDIFLISDAIVDPDEEVENAGT
jgi:hypothetical protein